MRMQLSHNGSDRQEIIEFIKKGKAEGQPSHAVFRNLSGKTGMEKKEILTGLLQEEVVFRFKREGSGRPGHHYVAAEYVGEYKKKYPKDTPQWNHDRL